MWVAKRCQGLRSLSVLLRSSVNPNHLPVAQISPLSNLVTTAFNSPNQFMSNSTHSLTCSNSKDTTTRLKEGDSTSIVEDDNESSEEEDGDGDDKLDDEKVALNVEKLMSIFKSSQLDLSGKKMTLEECDSVHVPSPLVSEILGRLRNNWESAFMFFLWAGKQPGFNHSTREYHSMIYILGKMRKFDTAWSLVDEMSKVKGDDGVSLVTPHTLQILIRRYCAVHDVGKAISTFHAHKRFGFDTGIEEFQNLLSALCRYKNVKDAEHLLFANKDVYPFCTKSFNIILNGWGNVVGSPREAERILMEMGKREIPIDVVTYASLISCYAKARNIHKVLRLF